ncbi:hypothetical protein SDRG_16891 [Saprolegnia diclina VS20]|uniref:Uncharacterized protein n=1 Tax=Saprolegnia diclina (strain VS20) TaxID=1156394 RepID=T0PSK0_SAPDV|nr:hypothetical protein SDRG_16891 [Saprolegnia diclina VS20]EQC25236.1 hypothetical protein SDRG_16891 [Saprolegnia diclina VS20]|eukprot:XP_008621337.1 hypothetical protein SDRG_16891 [Saprolegnia diclina VS20]
MEELRCFWNASAACTQEEWNPCNYGWLWEAPIGFVTLLWLVLGAAMLHHGPSTTRHFELDVAKIHDPLEQGMAIALAQRKTTSKKRPWLLRAMKLLGMWAEWPAYTYAPLPIAFRAVEIEDVVETLAMRVSPVTDVLFLALAVLGLLGALVLRRLKTRRSHDLLLHFICPLLLDVLYIPILTAFLHQMTCPHGFYRIPLPDGATCECVDRFGYFWFIGTVGFVGTYLSSLYYKKYMEPLSTTMDFRFQSGYDLTMVMARTLDPILIILIISLHLETHKSRAIVLALCLLLCMLVLLIYSYQTQPCIGSGRVPNNIRTLTYSSAIYTTLCVLAFLLNPNSSHHTDSHGLLYYSLTPLPLVWVASWYINDRRARRYHIPDLSIADLLHEPSAQANVVGAIAALYMDAAKVPQYDCEAIISRLDKFARSKSISDPMCRLYAIRTLWFCYIESFRKSKRCVGEPDDGDVVPHKLWLKDRNNPDRPISLPRLSSAHVKLESRVKVSRAEDLQAVVHEVEHRNTISSSIWRLASRFSESTSRVGLTNDVPDATGLRGVGSPSINSTMPTASTATYHVILVRHKHWISKAESPDAAVQHMEALYELSLSLLTLTHDMGHEVGKLEAARFLLEWYKSRYVRLTKATFLQVLTTLCASPKPKVVIDAVHSLWAVEEVFPVTRWLAQPRLTNQLAVALGHSSKTTVLQCATTLHRIFVQASTITCVNVYVLLTPEAMAALLGAFRRWADDYSVSDALEQLYLVLSGIEHQRKRAAAAPRGKPSGFLRRLSSASFNAIKATLSKRLRLFLQMPPPVITETSRRHSVVGVIRNVPSQVSNSRRMSFDAPSRVVPAVSPATPPTPTTPAKKGAIRASSKTTPEDPSANFKRLVYGDGKHQGPSSQPGRGKQFAFVPPDVLAEIKRRRLVRAAFDAKLHKIAADTVASTSEIESLVTMCMDAEDCALISYVNVAVGSAHPAAHDPPSSLEATSPLRRVLSKAAVTKAVGQTRALLHETPHVSIRSRMRRWCCGTRASRVEIERHQVIRDHLRAALQRAMDAVRQNVQRGPSISDVGDTPFLPSPLPSAT